MKPSARNRSDDFQQTHSTAQSAAELLTHRNQPSLRQAAIGKANVLFAADRGRWTGGLTVVC
jgi:hypothetical protein